MTCLRFGHVWMRSVDCPRTARCGTQEVEGPDAFELCLVQDGCFQVRAADGDVFVDPVTCLLGGPRHVVDVTHPAPRGDRSTFVAVGADVVDALGGDWPTRTLAAPVSNAMTWIHQRLLATADSWADEPMVVEEMAVHLFAGAMSGAGRLGRSAGRTERARRRLVDDARAALVADPTLSSVVELGRLLGCSPHHLSRVFTERTGYGVGAYRTRLRVRRALDQLSGGATDLARVAADCGFADHAHLTRTLRRHLNLTPSAARRILATPLSSMDVQAASAARIAD